jgi:hypothetical protein
MIRNGRRARFNRVGENESFALTPFRNIANTIPTTFGTGSSSSLDLEGITNSKWLISMSCSIAREIPRH